MLLGGQENALSIARNLGARGVKVRISNTRNALAMRSRYCAESYVAPGDDALKDFWRELLLGPGNERLLGQVIFGCNDPALEFLAEHREELRQRYLIVDQDPALQRQLLDKQATLELAEKAGVGAPKFWKINAASEVEAIRDQIQFPVMVKPINTHKFAKIFGRKLFIIQKDFSEVVEKVSLAHQHGMNVIVVEMIPGPDSLLGSYNTFMDPDGHAHYHYTKRIIRRYPVNRGGACYHVSEWVPEIAEAGQKFFKGIGFKGIGNVEFKRDLRDGRLKIIESNTRFVAAHELFVRSGAPTDWLVYCYLTKQELPVIDQYQQGLHMLYPVKDFLAYRELSQRGEINFIEWISTIAKPQILPVFRSSDPFPVLNSLLLRT